MIKTSDYITILLPKQLGINTIGDILRVAKIIFETENQQRPKYALDLTKVTKTNVLGMLLIYKIIEYSIEKNVFLNQLFFFTILSKKSGKSISLFH